MPKVIVTALSGQVSELDATPGLSVMQMIRDSGSDDLLALCGGCASCGTCHVYVDEAWLGKMPPMNTDEDELLATSEHRESNSRLSCQLKFKPEFDGLKVKIAPRS